MEHSHIDEHDVVSRYVAGTLPEDDTREFEAHFVDCARCLERIEIEQELRAGLLTLQGTWRAPGPVVRRETRAFVSLRTAAAAAVVVLAVGTTAAYFQARRQLDAALARTATLEREYEQARVRSARPPEPQPTTPSRVAVFELDSTRSAAEPSANAPSVALDSSTTLVVFSLAVGDATEYSSFAATIETPGGTALLQQTDLQRASTTSVAVAVDAAKLSAGDYTIVLTGLIRNRPPIVVARYPLRVIRR